MFWDGPQKCWAAGSKRDKQATLLTLDFHELDALTPWNALADMFSIIQSAHVAFVSDFLGRFFFALQERVAAAKKFHSKEAEEEAKKVPAKTFTPGLPDAQDITMEPQGPKVVAPTPEQITAIKVHAFFT